MITTDFGSRAIGKLCGFDKQPDEMESLTLPIEILIMKSELTNRQWFLCKYLPNVDEFPLQLDTQKAHEVSTKNARLNLEMQ